MTPIGLFCNDFHLVFTREREQGFHPGSTKVTLTGATLKETKKADMRECLD